jgi:hypothetical protein
LGLASKSSSWHDTYVFVELPQMKCGKFFW